jgi:hypothetical protein
MRGARHGRGKNSIHTTSALYLLLVAALTSSAATTFRRRHVEIQKANLK